VEWGAFENACRQHKMHLWRPASNLQRLKMFHRWLPQEELIRIADFQDFQKMCGKKHLGVTPSGPGAKWGVGKAHFEEFVMGSWPEVADPPTPEFVLAALPPRYQLQLQLQQATRSLDSCSPS